MTLKATLSLLAFAVGSLARRRVKAFALGGGLALSVALMAAVLFLTDSLKGEAQRARAALPDIMVQRLVGGRPGLLSQSDALRLQDIPSVSQVNARVWGYVFFPSLQGNVTIIGVPPGQQPLERTPGTLSQGRDLVPGNHEMVAGAGLAKYLGIFLGDIQGIPSPNTDAHPLKLVGTFDSSVELYAADVILCDEADARALLQVPPEEATDFALSVRNPAEVSVVAKTIRERLPGTRVVERALLARVHELAYGRRAGLLLGACIPALLALFVLAWDRMSGLGIEERREIATLKATGWGTSDVLAEKIFENLLVGLTATSLGLALAYVWVFVLGAPGLRPALVGFSVLYPETPLTPAVDGAQLLGIFLAILGPFLGISIFPAWRAAVTDPVDIMRGK
jgi:ABC-type lipoprotein release transport system permease subunit